MHSADVVEHVLVANGNAKARDQEIETKLHLEESPERVILSYPKERKVP